MPRWARLCATALAGGCLVLAGLFVIVWWRAVDRSHFWADLADFVSAPQSRGLLLLFIVLMAVVISLTRLAAALGWSTAVGALAAGLAVPLAYVLSLLAAWTRGAWAFAFVLRMSWADIGLFCLPFILAALFSAWLWERLPGTP